jgi:ubiquinone/menaquinone biosynthesis C-methylase UbiE
LRVTYHEARKRVSLAEQSAADAPVRVTVLDAPAEQLPVVDESFDAAVVSLVLCSVSDPALAVAELYRAIRPGDSSASTSTFAPAHRALRESRRPPIASAGLASPAAATSDATPKR